MKKTQLTIGLAFAAMLLTGCAGNKTAPVNKSELGQYGDLTFKVEFKDIYTGTNALKAHKNLLKNLTSGFSELEMTGKMISRYTNREYLSDYTGTYTIYSNNVATSTYDIVETQEIYGTKISKKYSSEDVAAVTEKGDKIIEREKSFSSGRSDIDLSVSSYNYEDLAEYIDLTDSVSTYGYYGVDKSGVDIYYYSDMHSVTHTGLDKNGNSVEVSTVYTDETLITFTGSAMTGKPDKMYRLGRQINYFDEQDVISEEGIVTDEMYDTGVFKYGKRVAYKDRDKFLSEVEKPMITSYSSPILYGYSAALSSDESSIISVASIPSYSRSIYSETDPDKGFGTSLTGLYDDTNLSLTAGYAYKFAMNITDSYVEYDSDKVASRATNTEYRYAKWNINAAKLPDTVKVLKYNDDVYLYCAEDTTIKSFNGTFKINYVEDEGVLVPSLEFTLA